LKDLEVQLIIIDDAEYLNWEAFCEVIQIQDMLKIPIILSGTHDIKGVLTQNRWNRVRNSFLDFYHFPPLDKDELISLIKIWEEEFLKWPEESDFRNEIIFDKIHKKTQGLRDILTEVLRKSAIEALDRKNQRISASIISSVLDGRYTPVIGSK
jgi:DNA transposition AAA+ family ATPase